MADSGNKLSFRKKDAVVCPICGAEHQEEVLRQGGGRLIADRLTDELRRLYKKSPKFGIVYPLAYSLLVCPKCFYASTPKEWNRLTNEEKAKLKATTQARQNSVKKILGPINKVDFTQDRDLELGAGSYLLAVDCYNFRGPSVTPTFKKALYSLRAAWLFSDMQEKYPKLPYKNVVNFFYRKAYANYIQVLDLFQSGKEKFEDAGRLGPDSDKDWSYEGLQYIVGVMVYRYGEEEEKDIVKRIEVFDRTRRMVARMFGSGRKSKNLPADLIEKTRDIHEKMGEMIKKWEEEAGVDEEDRKKDDDES